MRNLGFTTNGLCVFFLFLGGLKQTFVCCVFHTRTAFSAVTLEQYFLMAFSVKSPLAIDASLPLATNPPLSARLKNAQPWFHNKRALRVFFVFRRIKANFCLLCVSHTNRLLGGDARAILFNGFLSQITSRYWRFASACYESASLRQTKKCATLVSQQTGFACFFVLTLYWRYKVG